MVNTNLIVSIKKHHAFLRYISSTTKISIRITVQQTCHLHIYKIQILTGIRNFDYVWYHTTCRIFLQKRSKKRLENYNELYSAFST